MFGSDAGARSRAIERGNAVLAAIAALAAVAGALIAFLSWQDDRIARGQKPIAGISMSADVETDPRPATPRPAEREVPRPDREAPDTGSSVDKAGSESRGIDSPDDEDGIGGKILNGILTLLGWAWIALKVFIGLYVCALFVMVVYVWSLAHIPGFVLGAIHALFGGGWEPLPTCNGWLSSIWDWVWGVFTGYWHWAVL